MTEKKRNWIYISIIIYFLFGLFNFGTIYGTDHQVTFMQGVIETLLWPVSCMFWNVTIPFYTGLTINWNPFGLCW